jgi:riboflavin synthase
MFTGIIEELGKIERIDRLADAVRLVISGTSAVEGLKRGESISVSGACLTAIEITPTGFSADVMLETLRRTSLGTAGVGDVVNLERAMLASARFGGHVVQGHVDGVGTIVSREPSEHWEWVRIEVPAELMKYVVMKGSISFDGVSLTVNEIAENVVGVSLIPETLSLTTLGSKPVGAQVNIEVDIMAKHIERLLAARAGATEHSANSESRAWDGV